MNDVSASVCDMNIMVAKLNREVRMTAGCDVEGVKQAADAIEIFAKQIKEWCATKQ
jgi:hypothetical protein